MAKVNLDFETSIDLEEDEGIMLADFPRIKRVDGGKKVNLVITNKRVAAIPYSNSKKVESWYYNKDFTEAKTHTWNNHPISFGLISGRTTQSFFMNAKMTFKLFATILGMAAKQFGAGMAQEFNESQAREAQTDAAKAGRWTPEGMAFSKKAANNQAMAKVWEETAKNPTVHYKDEQDTAGKVKYLVKLINQCLEAAKG
jgi:hypothetical protein